MHYWLSMGWDGIVKLFKFQEESAFIVDLTPNFLVYLMVFIILMITIVKI